MVTRSTKATAQTPTANTAAEAKTAESTTTVLPKPTRRVASRTAAKPAAKASK